MYFKVINTNFKMLITILIALTILTGHVLAAGPGIPNAFYGTVTWNGQPAPDGTTVVAKINGAQVASTTTSSGKYGYPVGSFYVEDPSNVRTGSTVNFFVNNVDTDQTGIFSNGDITNLNLVASGTTGGQSSPGGGGGGGGGGYVAPSTNNNQTTTPTVTTQGCQEKWVCSAWSACQNGVQTRTCNDENKCGTNNKEPFSSQPCSAEERKQSGPSSLLLPTGFFLGLSITDWIIGAVVGVIAAVAIIFILTRRGTKRKR